MNGAQMFLYVLPAEQGCRGLLRGEGTGRVFLLSVTTVGLLEE
jgi:hypothetical protein